MSFGNCNKALLLTIILIASVLVSIGCKSGSGVTSTSIGVTPDFAPEPPTANSDFVWLEKADVSGGRIVLNVVVTEVSEPVSGIAMKITYPGDIALLDACRDGDLFAAGQCSVSHDPKGTGIAFIGNTIVAPEPPVPVSGSVTIVRIEFIVFGTGAGEIAFEAQNMGGGDASALLDANGDPIFVEWFAGTLSGM